MGHFGNMLPRHLARLGAELHCLTMDLPHNSRSTDRISSYGRFSDRDLRAPGTIEAYDGFNLHGRWCEQIAQRLKNYETSLL